MFIFGITIFIKGQLFDVPKQDQMGHMGRGDGKIKERKEKNIY
jgi:hypothetical protein